MKPAANLSLQVRVKSYDCLILNNHGLPGVTWEHYRDMTGGNLPKFSPFQKRQGPESGSLKRIKTPTPTNISTMKKYTNKW